MAQNIAQWWSYLAPVGNGLLVYWLLGNKQHERFVVGIDPIDASTGIATIDLTKDSRIAKDSLDDFKSSSHVVVATLVGASPALTPLINETLAASIDKDGILKIAVPSTTSVPSSAQVAWIVDTKSSTKKT
jgi:hypothetical protein